MIVQNLEKKEHSTATFEVTVDAEAFEKAIDKAYRRAKGSITVSGFRKGKAPRLVIEGLYGANVFHEDAVEYVASEAFDFGVNETGLKVVGFPSIAGYSVAEDKSCVITFSTDVYPEVTLGQYKGLEAEYEEVEITEQQVMDELENARKSAARLVDVERPVRMGDTIVLDFEGFIDDVPFEGGKGEDYSLEIGSGSFIPGFEEQLVGMELETDGEVHVTFPENYAAELAGKAAVFKVRVHGVKEPELPELDDEFAKDVSDYDTLEEYKESVMRDLRADAEEKVEREFRTTLLYKAIDNMTCEVPEGMIDDKLDEFLRSYADSMGLTGAPKADIIKSLGVSEQDFRAMMRPNALKQAQGDILLDKIIEVENIEVPQEEKDAFWKSIEEDYGDEAERVKAMIDESIMDRDLCRKRAAQLLCDHGVKIPPSKDGENEEIED